jgi:hypothetical protein
MFVSMYEFESLPLISDSYPLKFHDSEWTTFSVRCSACNKKIKNENVRGCVDATTAGDGYRTIARIIRYDIDAMAFCDECNLMTTAIYSFHEDMRMTGASPIDGNHTTWTPDRRSIFRKFKSMLGFKVLDSIVRK